MHDVNFYAFVQIKQVESQSLAHVRTINELQEQLHGAQNTAASLEVELQRANTELEETRKTLAEERMNILPTCDKVDSNKSKISRSKRHLHNRSVSSKNNNDLDAICSVPTDAKENMSSFRARNKKSELYRNGCTQRIRALKQRSPSADSSETNRKQASASNNRSKTGKNDNAKNTGQTRSIMEQILQTKFLGNCKGKRGQRSRPSYMHDSSDVHVKTEDKPSDTPEVNGCLLLIQALEQELSPPQLFTGHSGEGLTNFKDDLLMGGKDAESNLSMASPGPIDVHAVSNLQIVRRKRSKTVRVFESGCSESKSAPGNNLVRSTSEDTTFKSEQRSERIEGHSDTPKVNNVYLLSDAAEKLMRLSDAADKLMHPSDATENLINPSGANTDQFLAVDSSLLALQSTKSQVDGEGTS
jgi:myosin heavy subunit